MIDKSISWQDYLAIKVMNPSTLVHGIKSMRRLRRAIRDGFPEESDAMRLGSGIHALLLEPDEFANRFVVMPDFHLDVANTTGKGEKSQSKATTYYKANAERFENENADKMILDAKQYDCCLCCIEAIHERPHMVEMLHRSNKEVTVRGEIDGVPFKGRIDMLEPTSIDDLKTTFDVAQFERQTLRKFDYLFKMSIYRELVRQNTEGVRDVKIICQETKDDFDNAVFSIPSEILDHSFSHVLQVVASYKQACNTDEWLGWDRGEKEIEIEMPYEMRRDSFQSVTGGRSQINLEIASIPPAACQALLFPMDGCFVYQNQSPHSSIAIQPSGRKSGGCHCLRRTMTRDLSPT